MVRGTWYVCGFLQQQHFATTVAGGLEPRARLGMKVGFHQDWTTRTHKQTMGWFTQVASVKIKRAFPFSPERRCTHGLTRSHALYVRNVHICACPRKHNHADTHMRNLSWWVKKKQKKKTQKDEEIFVFLFHRRLVGLLLSLETLSLTFRRPQL